MISASQAFIDAVNGNGRSFRARILSDGAEVPCNIISITTNKGASDGQTFSVGSVFSHSADIILGKTSYVFENADITLQIGVLTDFENDTYEYITIGEYTVIKVQRASSQVTLGAVGCITSKMNVPLPFVAKGQSIQAVATAITNACGVNVSFVGIGGLSNTIGKDLDGITCRGALEIITFLTGGYATENHSGGVEIHKYSVESPVTFSPGRSLTEPIFADNTFEMTGVKVIVDEAAYILTQDTSVVADKEYYQLIDGEYEYVEEPTGNPRAQGWYEVGEISYSSGDPIRQTYQSEYMTQAIFNTFASTVIGYEFMPATIDMSLGDPRLEPWDTLSVTEDGSTYIVPCHLITGTFDGGYSNIVVASGESETDEAVEGTIARQVGDMAGQLAVTQTAATQAKTAAKAAQASADSAAEAAQNAWDHADDANDAAVAAQSSADAAGRAASAADEKAEAAGRSASAASSQATRAETAATDAIDAVSIVQDVIGTLEWVQDHGEYVATTDTEVHAGKYYFARSGTSPDYTYTVVVSPSGNPQAHGWYELSDIDEAVSKYVLAHLSLTDRGLWILPSGMGSATDAQYAPKYKLLLSNTGMMLYDGAGHIVSTYGESITFDSSRPQYIGGRDAFIAFYDSDDDGIPDSITIGGSSVKFGSMALDDVLSAASTAENTLIYDHTYEYVRDSNNKPIRADFEAFLYRGGVDVKTEFTPANEYFFWYLKREDKNGAVVEEPIGTGYTCSVSLDQCGYGAEVIGKFVMRDESEALTTNGDNLTTAEEEVLTVRATGDSVRVRDLTTTSTIFPTEKLMVVGTEDEHLVTIQTLQDYLNANLDKQVLFNTTAGWSAQTTLVSDANTLYVYTDHQRDSGGNAVAGIKAGDGLAYVVDLPFTDAIATEHIADTTRHITASERSAWNNHLSNGTIHVTASDKAKWDSAVKCYYAGTEQLVFAVV